MNFSTYYGLPISGHADIDFVDVHTDIDTKLYVDPERIASSDHSFAEEATALIDDFWHALFRSAIAHDDRALYQLLSFGHEPNETHLGLSAFRSRGNGTTPEIMLPIVHSMIRTGIFENHLVTQLYDLPLFTPNFGEDRLSDLTTNIIRSVLAKYTCAQFCKWGIPLPDYAGYTAPSWNIRTHQWTIAEYPCMIADREPILLVPKCFVGKSLLSSPRELLQKYALSYRQQDHLDERSGYCHKRQRKNGSETLLPPTKKEIYNLEVKDHAAKDYLQQVALAHPEMVGRFHATHRAYDAIVSDEELDAILYALNNLTA